MDRIYAVVIVLCVVFISTSPAAAIETNELTLEQAITLAIEKNPDLLTLRLEEEAAKDLSNNPLGNYHDDDGDGRLSTSSNAKSSFARFFCLTSK